MHDRAPMMATVGSKAATSASNELNKNFRPLHIFVPPASTTRKWRSNASRAQATSQFDASALRSPTRPQQNGGAIASLAAPPRLTFSPSPSRSLTPLASSSSGSLRGPLKHFHLPVYRLAADLEARSRSAGEFGRCLRETELPNDVESTAETFCAYRRAFAC